MRFLIIFLIATFILKAAEPDYEALAKQADNYDLPKPPDKASLVLANSGSTTLLGNSSTDLDPGIYHAGFLLKREADGSALVMVGFKKKNSLSHRKHLPATRPYTSAPPKPALGGYVYRGNHLASFATAIQCARRGDLQSARALVKLYEKSEYKGGFFTQEPEQLYHSSYSLLLARATFGYYYDRVLDPEARLPHCLKMLEKLTREFPALFSDDPNDYTGYRHRQFIKDLKLTVTSPRPKAGSIEELLFQYAASDPHTRAGGDALSKIYRTGIKGLPELARLTKSRKLTRKVNPAFMNARETRARLGEIARETLVQMVGSHLKKPLAHNQKYDWEGWLKQLDLSNERQFFLKALEDDRSKESRTSLSVPFYILVHKYPESLPELAKQLSKSSSRSDFANVIADCPATKEVKIEALKSLYRGQKGFDRRNLLQHLADIDQTIVIPELQALIRKFPKDVKKPYWTCEEADLTHVVMKIEDHAVWANYLKAAQRSKIGLRMEMMNPMNYSYVEDRNLTYRLAFLAAFLDDEESRTTNDSNRWDGPHAGFTFKTLSVQNFVAMQIGSLLKIAGEPSEFWTARDWAVYREAVKAALSKKQLPKL